MILSTLARSKTVMRYRKQIPVPLPFPTDAQPASVVAAASHTLTHTCMLPIQGVAEFRQQLRVEPKQLAWYRLPFEAKRDELRVQGRMWFYSRIENWPDVHKPPKQLTYS